MVLAGAEWMLKFWVAGYRMRERMDREAAVIMKLRLNRNKIKNDARISKSVKEKVRKHGLNSQSTSRVAV